MSAGVATCGRRCAVASFVLATVVGAVMGVGLLVSGMTDPAKSPLRVLERLMRRELV